MIQVDIPIGRNQLRIAFRTLPSSIQSYGSSVDCTLTVPAEGKPERPEYYKPEQKIEWKCSKEDLEKLQQALELLL